MTALIMFPAFSLIFGAAQLTGVIIIQNANQDISIALLGLTVQVVPLFITPFLIKLSSGLLGTIAGIANDRSKGVFDRTKNWADSNRKLHRARGIRNGLTEGRRGNRFRPTTYGARAAMKGIDREARTKAYTGQAQALYDNNTRRGRRTALETNRATREGEITKQRNNERFERALAGDPTGEDARRLRTGPQWAQNTVNSALDHAINNRQAARNAAQFDDLGNRLHEAHASEVNAGILHDRFHNQGDQHARDAIAAAAGQNSYLGRIHTAQIESIEAAGLAENSKNLVEAQGKLALKQTIEGDAHRTQQVVLTQQYTKDAEQYDTIVQKIAEGSYDNYSRTNQAAQELRLRAVQQTDHAKHAEEQWNTLVANIQATGSSAPNLAPQSIALADSIQGLTRDIEIEAHAQNSAKVVQQGNLAAAFKEDEALRTRAGGIGGEAAATRIYAKAKKEVISASMEAIDNSRSIISEYTPKQLIKLHREGLDKNNRDVSDNEALRFAAMQELLLNKGNNWALQKLRDDTAIRFGMIYDEDAGEYYDTVKNASGEIAYDANGKAQRGRILTDDEVDKRRDAQQLFADAAKKSPLKVANLSQTDLSDFESGTSVTDGKQAIIRDIIMGKFDRQKIASLDVDELQRMVMVIRDQSVREQIDAADPEALDKLRAVIDGAQEDPMVSGSIKDRERGVMFALASYIDPAERDRDDADREKHYYWEKNEDGAIVRRHPGDANANRSEASVIPSQEYLRDQFLNSKGRGPDGTL
jgi:hypothetical protein